MIHGDWQLDGSCMGHLTEFGLESDALVLCWAVVTQGSAEFDLGDQTARCS